MKCGCLVQEDPSRPAQRQHRPSLAPGSAPYALHTPAAAGCTCKADQKPSATKIAQVLEQATKAFTAIDYALASSALIHMIGVVRVTQDTVHTWAPLAHKLCSPTVALPVPLKGKWWFRPGAQGSWCLFSALVLPWGSVSDLQGPSPGPSTRASCIHRQDFGEVIGL